MIKERGMYYATNDFYDIIRKLGGDCGNPGRRPIVCLIKSAEHKDLYWAIPLSKINHRTPKAVARLERFLSISDDKIESCYYHRGRTTNRSIFALSDTFPITEKYIDEEHLNDKEEHHIIKNKPLIEELERKLFRILAYENANPNCFRQHITNIKNYLLSEITTEDDIVEHNIDQ